MSATVVNIRKDAGPSRITFSQSFLHFSQSSGGFSVPLRIHCTDSDKLVYFLMILDISQAIQQATSCDVIFIPHWVQTQYPCYLQMILPPRKKIQKEPISDLNLHSFIEQYPLTLNPHNQSLPH